MAKQKLSVKALLAKRRRDKKAAMSSWGKYKKRTAQKKNCPPGSDYDHASGRCIPRGTNRAKNSRSGSVKKKYGY
tara:strand:+ start:621 stop:845 length:225 start_codon:yes stop_codon:yes gene_type:complete